MNRNELISLAVQAANNQAVDPALVCAVIEQESGWHPYVTRYEPAFERRYVQPLGVDWVESKGRSTSFGLMQVMGEVLRELGFSGGFCSLMEDIPSQLSYGVKHLKNKLEHAGGDVHKGLQLWNGGGNPHYADQVVARMPAYQAQKPLQGAQN